VIGKVWVIVWEPGDGSGVNRLTASHTDADAAMKAFIGLTQRAGWPVRADLFQIDLTGRCARRLSSFDREKVLR
jgi:hypothetical protein